MKKSITKLNSSRGQHVYTMRLYVICILMFITLSGCQKKIIADSTSTVNEFVPNTNNDQIDNKIKETLSKEEMSNVDFCGWIDDSEECYQIGICRSQDVEGEYRHLKDYFFVKKDDTVKTLEVTYPSKSDDPFSDRYPLDVCEFDAVYQDVSFDGNKDIVISLGNSKYSSIHCAYVYESGEFQYKKSFENIPDYVVDEKSNSILGRERSSFYQYKYMNGQFQPVINDDSLEPIIEKYIALNDDCSIYSKEWVDPAKECYRLQIQRFNKEKGTKIHDGDIFFINNKDKYESFDISYPYDDSDTTTTERAKEEYTWDDTDISCAYVDENNDGIKEIVITITTKNENKPEKYAFQYNEFGNWDRICQIYGRSPSDKKETEFIKKYLSEINVEERNYSLFYLNDDDIPEFAVYGDGTIHNGLVDVYTLEEGKIIELGRYGSYDSVYYKDREGILVEEYDGTSGSFYTNIYKMEKGQIVVVEKFEVKCWDEDKTYFVNGEETDVETYVSLKKKYRDNLSMVGAS